MGDNHTKYKGKYNSNSSSGSSALSSGGQNSISSMPMQITHGVHYPQGNMQQQLYMGYQISNGDESINMQEGY